MQDLINRYLETQTRIRQAEKTYHRAPHSVKCLAVSKGFAIDSLRSIISVGQRAFGENYLDEALTKILPLGEESLEWHFIGRIQSRKCKEIAQYFGWVHTLYRKKEADKLSKLRPKSLPPLQVCIQVKTDSSPTKEGVVLDELFDLAHYISQLPNLSLRGLMTLPPETKDFQQQRQYFKLIKQAGETLMTQGIAIDTYSMGMTQDLEAAIAEGATIIRVGQGIFGTRVD